jgi:pyruvate carboxylase
MPRNNDRRSRARCTSACRHRLLRMQKLGDKTSARKLAEEAGVSVVPGTNDPIPDVEAAQAFAAEAGYPVMLKAAMGGGGRGMRVVKRCA